MTTPDSAKDAAVLDQIARWLQHPDWGVGMLEDIAEVVVGTGRDIDTKYQCWRTDDDVDSPSCDQTFWLAADKTWTADENNAGEFTEKQMNEIIGNLSPNLNHEWETVDTWDRH